jgi:hypothetical protein
MKHLIRITAILAAILSVAGCANYTGKKSPCVGTKRAPEVSRSAYQPSMSFAPQVSQNATLDDCIYRPIGS